MDTREMIGIIAGLIAFSSYFFYIPSILKGDTKPNRASWWIWGLVGILILVSYYASGARGTIWVPLGEAIGPILVALLSIKYGEGGWTRFDKWCLAGAGAGTFLWWATSSATIGLLSYLLIDVMAVLPTIRKSIYRPEGEDKTAWALTFTGQFLNLFAVERFIFSILIYPIYMVITNGIILSLQFKKRGLRAFSSIDIVSQCLVDIPRTTALGEAINQTVKNGDIVLDAGTGSGILSLFAARAGAKKVIALEFDPFIAEAASKVVKENNYENVIDIKVADSRNYEFDPGTKFDVVIVEMLTTGMVDEYQVNCINNLHSRKIVDEKTKFIPYKQDTFVTLGNFNFNSYGFSLPFIRHLWRFHREEMKEFKPLTAKTILNSIDFSKINPEKFDATIDFEVKEDGIINSIYLSSVTHLTENMTLDDTNALNGPVAIPIDPVKVKNKQKVKLKISYNFGGGYESLKALAVAD